MNSLHKAGVINLPQIVEGSVERSNGRVMPVIELHVGERDSYVIVAQLSPEFTAKLVDRWRALESGEAARGSLAGVCLPSTTSC